MSPLSIEEDDGRGSHPARGQVEWKRADARLPGCRDGHHDRMGQLDESARRLSHEELLVARLLASEGHRVRSLAESNGRGRVADLQVCGQDVEVKSFLPADQRTHAPTRTSVSNKVIDASRQAPIAVVVGRGSGLTATEAEAGMAELGRRPGGRGLAAVRIVGDGFDLAWQASRVAERARTAAPRRRSSRAADFGLGVDGPG